MIVPPQVDREQNREGSGRSVLAGRRLRREGRRHHRSRGPDAGYGLRGFELPLCELYRPPATRRRGLCPVVRCFPWTVRGLKLYCRPPYAPGKPSVFDYPLSTRFDETDALVVFDDVFVPWENVFVYRDVGLVRAQFFETPAHVLGNNQAQIRLTTKMKFVLGVARKIAAVNRIDTFPTVQDKLGELASLAAIVEGMALASEATFRLDDNGVARPNPRFLYGAMGLQAELYPRALHMLRELAGGGLLQVPSTYKELTSPETGPEIKRYLRSPGVPAGRESQTVQAGLGSGRIGIWRTTPAVRDVLRGCALRFQGLCLPQLSIRRGR